MRRDLISGTFIETHGMTHTAEYGIWADMLYRCRTASSPQFPGYGARGITFCEEWLLFENFISDMGPRPTPEHSLDRIDPEGNYTKHNCRWATPKMQGRNRRNSRKIRYNGVEMHIHDYCEMTGTSIQAVISRFKRGWTDERIIATPVRGGKNKC